MQKFDKAILLELFQPPGSTVGPYVWKNFAASLLGKCAPAESVYSC